MKHRARIQNGQLLMADREAFKNEIAGKSDGEYIINLEKPVRSNSDNRYYWGVIVKMVTDSLREHQKDLDPETTHEFLKQKFNPAIIILKDSEQTVGKTTTKLKQDEFYNYCERIKRWSSEYLEIYIPDKGEGVSV